MSDSWKHDLGAAMQSMNPLAPQAESCESTFLNGLTADSQELATQFLNRLLERGKTYVNCRFGADTPQAQAAFGDLSAIVSQCGITHFSKLFTGGFSAFAAAVTSCVAAKLLGGIGGGSQTGFQERSVARCGDQR